MGFELAPILDVFFPSTSWWIYVTVLKTALSFRYLHLVNAGRRRFQRSKLDGAKSPFTELPATLKTTDPDPSDGLVQTNIHDLSGVLEPASVCVRLAASPSQFSTIDSNPSEALSDPWVTVIANPAVCESRFASGPPINCNFISYEVSGA